MTLTATRSRTAGLLTALTMTALLAACSADSGGDAVSGEASSETSSSSSDSSSGSGAGRSATESDDGGSTNDSAAPGGPASPDLQRAVISSGTVSLAGEDVRETRRDVQRVVDAQGGEITEETTETGSGGETSYVRMVVRVPSPKFAETMSALEQVGVLRSSDRGSEDVTTKVIDTGARVRAQEASLRRVELLLADARDLKDVIWIESQLTGRQAELDSLKSQQSWLADQTALSTITVDISTHQVVDEPEEDRPAGFLAGLDGGSKALAALVTVLTTIVGALLPFAAVALVLGLPAWLVVRRRRAAAPRTPA